MSRLQVGGLALTLFSAISKKNEGLVCVIDEFLGDYYQDGNDVWSVSNSNLIRRDGVVDGIGHFASKDLMPLGDKQTQDELVKEKELECLK